MRQWLPVRTRGLLICGVALTVLGTGLEGRADAATFTVTRTDDPTPNGCLVSDCSLREAIIAANAATGSTVTIPAGTYTLTIAGTGSAENNPNVGDLDIVVPMTINGAGASTIVRQGAATGRVFEIYTTGAVRIANMSIQDGEDDTNEGGGCIRNVGALTLDSVTISGCTGHLNGGGISSFNSLIVIRSTITGNTVVGTSSGAVVGGGIAGGPGIGGNYSTTVKITDSVISNNSVSNPAAGNAHLSALGGGFSNTTIMTISKTTISGNTALNVGGGINDGTGTVTISESTISNNSARFDVGGVDNDGQMTINNSTFSGNQAGNGCVGAECLNAFAGGALNTGVSGNPTMNVNNSTFSGNTCGTNGQSGGGILNAFGTLNIRNSTFTLNTCNLSAGVGNSATTTMANTIVANNTAGALGGDCGGTITSQGYNIVKKTTGCTFSATTGDQVGVDPSLVALASNGGPTQTHALNSGSPARNAGNPSGCLNNAGALLQGDERGYARPQEARCDIGAFEYGIEALVVYRLRHPTVGAYLFTLYPQERDSAQWQYGYLYEGICCNWLASNVADGRTPLYRLYSGTAGEYFFTIYTEERDSAVASFGYVYEGPAAYCYTASASNRTPWYRLRYGNKHLYTAYASERDYAMSLGYVYEGVTCYLPAP